MTEVDLIRQIRQMAGPATHQAIVHSIGDDCAVIRPVARQDLVFTTDFVIEGRHFTLDTHTPGEVGQKALARSLSDLAAMGAQPLFCLVSLALPAAGAKKLVPAFYRGLLGLARRHKVSLAGGDLAQFDHLIADVMCCGTVPQGQALLRGAAKPGDVIYVTGRLGDSAAGLRTRMGAAWKRHRRPTPRIEAGLVLRRMKIRCAMDISDGLSLDLARLCAESNVSAALTSPLPVARGATLDDALNGGEDYELLFTAAPQKKVPSDLAGLRVSRIGVMTERRPDPITLDGKPVAPAGFDHFKALTKLSRRPIP